MVWNPRYAKRRDKAEPAIVEALQDAGYMVMRLDEFDLLVGNTRTGRVVPMEVKDDFSGDRKRNGQDYTHGSLTKKQRKLKDQGWFRFIHVVRNSAQALRVATEQTGDA